MAQKSLKNCTVTIKDGGSNSIELKLGEGTITWNEKRTIEYTLNRGKVGSADGGATREGDDQPLEVSFDLIFEYWKSTGSENATPVEALKKEGAAATWDTTDTDDPCAPYCVDIEIEYDPECGNNITNPIETITIPRFRYESISGDISAGTLSVSGTCGATSITSVRSA